MRKGELIKRGLNVIEINAPEDEMRAEAKIVIDMSVFKRPAADNTSEFAGKLAVAMMTMGFVTPYKDAAGHATLAARPYDTKTSDLLWLHSITDFSYRPIGEANFDVEELTKELFEPFE